MSTNRSISKLTIINLLGAVFGIVYSIVQARIFGVSRLIEVFFATQVIIQTMIKMTQSSMISAIFMPYYHKLKEQRGKQYAEKAYSVIINWMFVFATAICLILWISAPYFVPSILPGYSKEFQTIGLGIFRMLIFLVPFQVLISLFNLPFNAEKKFGRQELISSSNNLIYILVVLFTYRHWGVYSMVVALMLGVAIQFFGFIVMLKKLRYTYTFRLKLGSFDHWSIFIKMMNSVSYTASHQVYAFALTAGSSYLPPGYYAAFRYVQNLYSRTNVILLRPISTVFFTEFSEANSKGQTNIELKNIIKSATQKAFTFSFVCAIMVVVAGDVTLSFLWGGDKFGPEHINLCYYLMIVFFGLLIFPALNQIYNKINITYGYIRQQYLGASIVQLISAFFAWWLIPELGFNALLIILGGNLILKLLNSIRIVVWKRRDIFYLTNANILFKWAIISSVAIVGTHYLFYWIDSPLGVSRWYDFVQLGLRCTFAFSLTFLVGLVLKIKEFIWLSKFIKKKIGIAS